LISIYAMTDPHHGGLIAVDGRMMAGLLTFADILHAANRLAGARVFRVSVVSADAEGAALAHQLAVIRTGELPSCDTLVVPGFWADSMRGLVQGLDQNRPRLRGPLRTTTDQIILGYCTGVCLLADAGLLAGRAATVTWWVQERMRQTYPKVDWQTDLDFVRDGNVVTASGAMGHVPLALWLVKHIAGEAVMHDVSRFMVLPRPPVEHDAFRGIALIDQPTSLTRRLHKAVIALPATELSTATLSQALTVSGRTLSRRVHGDTGEAIGRFVRRIKLSQVAQRLAETAQSPAAISAELGFSSEANMRRMFKALTGMTLGEYRRAYGRFAR
jgi:transcriptional regulator GlxA family with amidase domain